MVATCETARSGDDIGRVSFDSTYEGRGKIIYHDFIQSFSASRAPLPELKAAAKPFIIA